MSLVCCATRQGAKLPRSKPFPFDSLKPVWCQGSEHLFFLTSFCQMDASTITASQPSELTHHLSSNQCLLLHLDPQSLMAPPQFLHKSVSFILSLPFLCFPFVLHILMDFNNIPPFNTSTTTTNTAISTTNPPLFPFPSSSNQQTFPSNLLNFQGLYHQSNLLNIPQSIFPINPFSGTGFQNVQLLGGFPSFAPPSLMFPMHPLPQIAAQNPLPITGFFDGAPNNQINQNFGLLPNVHLPKQSNPFKEARENRRMVRKMHSSVSQNKPKPPSSSSSSSSSSSFTSNIPKASKKTPAPTDNNEEKDLYIHTTFDGIKLKFLLQKVLQKTDVGSLGRIVLPKKAAEENLPWLNEKEGIQVMLREFDSTQMWHMRYRFWQNNNSRMYVLDSTGEYAKQHQLKYGDILRIYEDENKQF